MSQPSRVEMHDDDGRVVVVVAVVEGGMEGGGGRWRVVVSINTIFFLNSSKIFFSYSSCQTPPIFRNIPVFPVKHRLYSGIFSYSLSKKVPQKEYRI